MDGFRADLLMIKQDKYQIVLAGRPVSYVLRRSTRARYARLEISPEKGLVVVLPRRDNVDRARQLLEQKQRWVIEKLVQFTPVSSAACTVRDGDTIPYLGQKLTVRTITARFDTVCMDITRQTLTVFLTPVNGRLQLALEKWYRSEAEYMIRQLTVQYSRLMALNYHRIIMKGQKTLWGSCSRQRNLNFNWRLIMAPEPVIIYVVVHELAHLKHMNHSQKFWQLVEKYCPDWHDHRSWLRIHSAELNRVLRG